VEFLRRRLILLHEVLSDDGIIFVKIDYHFGHYIKIILDEVFGKNNFRNEITVNRIKKNVTQQGRQSIPTATDSIFLYFKSEHSNLVNVFKRLTEEKAGYWHAMDSAGIRRPRERVFFGKTMLPPDERHFSFTQDRIDRMIKEGKIRLNPSNNKPEYWIEPKSEMALDTNWTDIPGYSFTTGYPTENSEETLYRVINCSTKQGDLIMDVFAGSGTSLVVAEKLGRRWIGCDMGKLAIYTIQKRLLEIEASKDLLDKKKKYSKPAKSFAIVTSGLYDLGKIFNLQKDDYIRFVKDLFEIEEAKQKSIGGVEIDGKKREFYVKIFPYWELKNASVDEKYLQELHKNIGKKIDGRFYIIAPANNVNFISDYHQIGDVRYYFLKVPYQIIKELHKVQFKKFRQPQSKSQINDLDDAVGFHFIRQPEVKSEIKKLKDRVVLKIKKFESAYSQDETGEKLKNFESLAMLLVDLNYDGEKFMMTNYFFAQDLLNEKKKEGDESEEEIKKKLTKQREIIKEFPKKDCGKQIMAIYVDIYGNEFLETFKVK